MARGIQVLFDQMWPSLKGSGYLFYVEQEVNQNDGMPSHYDPFLMSIQQDLDLLSRTFEEVEVTPEVKEVYDKAVLEISSMCYAISNGGKSVLSQCIHLSSLRECLTASETFTPKLLPPDS
jgi:hypothetical protein